MLGLPLILLHSMMWGEDPGGLRGPWRRRAAAPQHLERSHLRLGGVGVWCEDLPMGPLSLEMNQTNPSGMRLLGQNQDMLETANLPAGLGIHGGVGGFGGNCYRNGSQAATMPDWINNLEDESSGRWNSIAPLHDFQCRKIDVWHKLHNYLSCNRVS